MVFESVLQMTGGTPMLMASRFSAAMGISTRIFAKLEGFNPSGSAKDRTALFMIEGARRKGILTDGGGIVEPTSGNTGIGLASVAAAMGYKLTVTMPDTASVERVKTMRAYGAEVVLTNGSLGMSGAVLEAERIARDTGAFLPNQFENEDNPLAHYMTTAPEIWEDCPSLDAFVAGVGTGGTITGVGRYLKSKNERIRIFAVEPSSSPVLSGGVPSSHGIQGIGAGFVPSVLDTSVYDEVVCVNDEEAMETARLFAKTEGVLVGISSGAVLHAAALIGKRDELSLKTMVVLLPDGGDRYFSTSLF